MQTSLHPPRWRDGLARWVVALPAAVALAVLAIYAMLLPGGRWEGDDYLLAWFVDQRDWITLFKGFLWAPRPIAQPLTWLYVAVSNATGRPLVAEFLAALWLCCIAGIALAGRAGRVRRPVAAAVALFALLLLLIKPGQMFYWPMAAASYLPCWAGLAAVTLLHRSAIDRHRRALTLSLLAATLSLEIGAITVLYYTALLAGTRWREPSRRWAWPLVLPVLCAVVECVQVLRGRLLPMREVFDPSSGLAGNWPGSFAAALPGFFREAVGVPGLPLLAGAGVKLLLLLALPRGAASRGSVAWAAALLLGAFTSVVLAYHQFGLLCCERNATLRQGMVLLALATVAGLLAAARPLLRHATLAAILGGLLAVQARALYADWRALPAVVAAQQRTWDSAVAPGDAMTVVLLPPGRITNAENLPPGSYHRESDVMWTDPLFATGKWYAWGVMARFHKHDLVIGPDSH